MIDHRFDYILRLVDDLVERHINFDFSKHLRLIVDTLDVC